MREIFLDKNSNAIKQVCQPFLKDDFVLIAIHYSCVTSQMEFTSSPNHATSQHSTNIPQKISEVFSSIATNNLGVFTTTPNTLAQSLGFSCSGQIIALGNKVRSFKIGDYVACLGSGYMNQGAILCLQEHAVVKITNPRLIKSASITGIGSIALQAFRRANIQLGETICVYGLGILGQILIKLATLAGCSVIGIDDSEERLKNGKKIGAHATYNTSDIAIIDKILATTYGQGVACTFITLDSNDSQIIKNCIATTQNQGKIVLTTNANFTFSCASLYQKEIEIISTYKKNVGPNQQEHYFENKPPQWTHKKTMLSFLSLIEREQIVIDDFHPILSSIQKIDVDYKLLKNKNSSFCLVTCQENVNQEKFITKQSQQTAKNGYTFLPAKQTSLRVGFIGFGGFAKKSLLPIVSNLNNVTINAFVDPNISSIGSHLKKYDSAKFFLHDNELFEKNLVDVVVIASPHQFHCQQAIMGLQNGRAVFVEKPMVTDFEQLETIKKFLDANPDLPFCVDYNRSFAPFTRQIKKAVQDRKGPLMLNYRFNAGIIPKEHWIQTEVGAGRIIGEACHIIDLFHYITDSQPIAISVESLIAEQYNLFPTDNFSAQISFADGSICTLMYTSLGHQKLSREYCEIFFDSKTIVMDDYQQLKGYGLPWSFNQKLSLPDKGHEHLLQQFFTNLNQETFAPPIKRDRLYSVAKTTLIIDQLACQGGGQKEF